MNKNTINYNKNTNNKTNPKSTPTLNRVKNMTNDELISGLHAIELSADSWLKTFFVFADESVLEKCRVTIVKTLEPGETELNPIKLLNNEKFKFEHLPIEIFPALGLIGDVQVFETEMDKRGLLHDYMLQLYFERYDYRKQEFKFVRYPSYAVRALDLIIGYSFRKITPLQSAEFFQSFGEYVEKTINAEDCIDCDENCPECKHRGYCEDCCDNDCNCGHDHGCGDDCGENGSCEELRDEDGGFLA